MIHALLLAAAAFASAAGTTRVVWHGHAAFEITTPKGHVLMVDPWLTNPKSDLKPEAVKKCDYILVTHGHFDHVGDSVALAKATKAKLVTNFELGTNMVRLLGFPEAQAGFDTLFNRGGRLTLADGEVTVEMTPAVHSSGLDAGKDKPVAYGGEAGGFVIKIKDGPTIYDSGDTAYFKDMDLIAQNDVDLALVNIGGHFGMEPDAAALAAQAVNAKVAVPMHYATFPVLTQDASGFFSELDRLGVPHRELKPGQALDFSGRDLKN